MDYIGNAFSLGMVESYLLEAIRIRPVRHGFNPVTLLQAKKPAVSVVGHEDIARILGVPFNRQSVKLLPGDELFVAQYYGERLPEGCTTLPPNAVIKWVSVKIRKVRWSEQDAQLSS